MRVFLFCLFFISMCVCKEIGGNPFSTLHYQTPQNAIPKPSDIFYQSNDGGKTWQDLSASVPEKIDIQHIYSFDNEYYMVTAKGDLYSSNDLSNGVWEQETVRSIFNNVEQKGEGIWRVFKINSEVYATIYKHGYYKKISKNVWMPVGETLQEKIINSIVATSDHAIALGTESGIYKSFDDGKTWQHVLQQKSIVNLFEHNGILMASSPEGLIRSTDNGASWVNVIQEKGVSFLNSVVEGHFVAIREFDPDRNNRSLLNQRCSYISSDNGKTWQCIDGLLSPVEGLYDFKKIGNNLYCGHKNGIYRSTDNGFTWELLLPMRESTDPWRLELIPNNKGLFVAKVWAGC
jgi:photosystem II stability/assembly factor-like uncharacterized protein